MKKLLFLFIAMLFPHPVVQDLDINRFMGRWYVIAIIPNWIEDGTNSYDDYKLNIDGTIDISYHAIKDGVKQELKQKGYVNENEPARWKIQFMKPYIPFYRAPYEVIILDSNYEYMVVGYPENSYGWIMARSANMNNKIYKNIINQLESEFNYEKGVFEKIIHNIQ
tara:strand:+ start:1306 stop:1803 length:498 start_codon:yes stop_codon:yes gene_type:complete